MKIYDCFTFYNELMLLELRLETLWDKVDFFVIAESPFTHSGQHKPLYFYENQHLFSKFATKIRHIVVSDMPSGLTRNNAWEREHHQRQSLMRGLWDMQPNDLIITSDVDEIPRPTCVQDCQKDTSNARWILFCPMYLYKFNYMRIANNLAMPWIAGPNIIVTKAQIFTDPQTERSFTFPWTPLPASTRFIAHGGWHWSSLGDNTHGILKLQSFAHTEANVPEIIENFDIFKFIVSKSSHEGPGQHFETVVVDDYFPQSLTDNRQKYTSFILPETQFSTLDFYSKDIIHAHRS
jgi:hypothetical protein